MNRLVSLLATLFCTFLSFWLLFFKFAPYVASLLPNNAWAPFLHFLVYVVIVYLGGLGIPLFILIIGLGLTFSLPSARRSAANNKSTRANIDRINRIGLGR